VTTPTFPHKCPRCKEFETEDNPVDERYSFGCYAGILCRKCAIRGYIDHCGIDRPMGTPSEWNELGDVPYDDD
jgi:hypothetical protein